MQAAPAELGNCEAILSPGERERADRFRLARLRQNFILRRGCLRILLAHYLGIDTSEIRLVAQDNGKLQVGGRAQDIRFNLSNSGDLAAVAISRGRELGVDIEAVRPLPDFLEIAKGFFSPEETNDILSVPDASRVRAFFAAWSRKEAYAKASGEGLRVPFKSFRVTLRPEDAPCLVHVGGDRAIARLWNIKDFHPSEGFTGAIAYQGDPMEIRTLGVVAPADILGRGGLRCQPSPCGSAPLQSADR